MAHTPRGFSTLKGGDLDGFPRTPGGDAHTTFAILGDATTHTDNSAYALSGFCGVGLPTFHVSRLRRVQARARRRNNTVLKLSEKPPVLEKDISPVDKSESFIEVGCDLRDPADQKHSEISARRIVRHAVTREHSHEQS